MKPDNQPANDVKIVVIQVGTNPGHRQAEFPPIQRECISATSTHQRYGTISMARSGPDTTTSDFFIRIGNQPSLNFGGARNPDGQGFAAFGTVTAEMYAGRRIRAAPAAQQALQPPIRIISVRRIH